MRKLHVLSFMHTSLSVQLGDFPRMESTHVTSAQRKRQDGQTPWKPPSCPLPVKTWQRKMAVLTSEGTLTYAGL